jgi:hypothetical protein
VNVKVVDTRKGSRFYLCTLSDVDPRFPKYPRIPVLRCHGYVSVDARPSRDGLSAGDAADADFSGDAVPGDAGPIAAMPSPETR